jgi:phosphoenolpyruvate synthase/pyruvate phosphate dikinase
MFLAVVAERLGLNMEEAKYTYIDELPGMLSDRAKVDRGALQERKSFVLVINTLEGYQMVMGNDAKQVFEAVFKAKDIPQDEIKGTIASAGKARGRVKIIRKIHDMVNMAQGDVLVASMTRPEMLPAMKKAAAIVTDEGGVTCHAAIVSRELGIPCIIGTKIATNAFKDGDEVEVDAGAGMVRIIRRT